MGGDTAPTTQSYSRKPSEGLKDYNSTYPIAWKKGEAEASPDHHGKHKGGEEGTGPAYPVRHKKGDEGTRPDHHGKDREGEKGGHHDKDHHAGKDHHGGKDHHDHAVKVINDKPGEQSYIAGKYKDEVFIFDDKCGGDDTIKGLDDKHDVIKIEDDYDFKLLNNGKGDGDVVIAWGKHNTITIKDVESIDKETVKAYAEAHSDHLWG